MTIGRFWANDGHMTAQEVGKQINERVVPMLSELGVEAFVMAAYVKDGDGKVTRVTFGAPSDNPAYDDGLRNIITLANQWGAGQL